jgi:hypothetical protein
MQFEVISLTIIREHAQSARGILWMNLLVLGVLLRDGVEQRLVVEGN